MLLGSCTNNGDIGALYGLWATEGCTFNGMEMAEDDYQDFYWRFQGDIVAINELIGAHEHLEWIGTFVHDGQSLCLDFSEGEVDTEFYPKQIGLVAGKMELEVVELTGSHMTLRYQSPLGIIWQYRLRKSK